MLQNDNSCVVVKETPLYKRYTVQLPLGLEPYIFYVTYYQ